MKTHALFRLITVLILTLNLLNVGIMADDPPKKDGSKYGELDAFVIDNFEHGRPTNYAGGISGSWKLNPKDIKSYCKSSVVKMPGLKNSKKCLKLDYSLEGEEGTMTGYWTKLKMFDARNYDHFEFDVKGDSEAGFTTQFRVELKRFKDAQKKNKLTGMRTIRNITDQWKTVSIPLVRFNGLYDKTMEEVWEDPDISIKDLDEMVIVFHERQVSSKKGVIYLDNIRFVKTGKSISDVFARPPPPPKDKAYIILEDPSFTRKIIKRTTKGKRKFQISRLEIEDTEEVVKYLNEHRDETLLLTNGTLRYKCKTNKEGKFGFLDHDNYMKFLVDQMRGFPKRTIVRKDFPEDDKKFLRTIARDTWGFFDKIINVKHGLPLDTITLGKKKPLGKGCVIADYTNITNIGVYLCCVVAAYDLKFITREDAVSRLQKTLNTIKNLETSKYGFLYNYYDTTWAKRTEFFISFVDSGWVHAGLFVVKNAFPDELGGLCKELIDKRDFGFFYDRVEQLMWHGYYENMEDYVDYHYGIFYAEPRLPSLIAIAKGDVEEAHWFKMVRTFPDNYDWTTQRPQGRIEKRYKDTTYHGGWYEYKDYKFVPSWGGSMFEALMPTLLIDEKKWAPNSLGRNNKTHTEVSIDYTLNELNYPVWGMSPSSNPEGGYSEYGVKQLGTQGYKSGVVTPHATFLALYTAPREAIENLRDLLAFDIYGEYGFYDSVDPQTGDVGYKYLALDQGMILMAIDNYLNDGVLRKYIEKDPIFKKAKRLLAAENFFD